MKKVAYVLLIIIVSTVFFFSLVSAIGFSKLSEYNSVDGDLLGEDIYISIQHESNPLELPNTKSTIDEFKRISNSFENGFLYYQIYTQPMNCIESQISVFDSYTNELSALCDHALCIQIDDSAQRDFGLSPLIGSGFDSEDFNFSRHQKIPIMLGNDYLSIYNIGDSFTAEYLFSSFTFEVIGILDRNTIIITPSGAINLDKYIVMPNIDFLNAPVSETEYVTQKIHYANRTSGYIKTSKSDAQKTWYSILDILSSSEIGEYSLYSTSDRLNYLINIGIDVEIVYPCLCIIAVLSGIMSLLLPSIHEYKNRQQNSTGHIFLRKIRPYAFVDLFAVVATYIPSIFLFNLLGLRFDLFVIPILIIAVVHLSLLVALIMYIHCTRSIPTKPASN